jgi:hypothetical protein
LIRTTRPSCRRPKKRCGAALEHWRNGTFLGRAVRDGSPPGQLQGEGKAFLDAIAECNLEITKAILTQQLATEEGEHQARAAAQVHQDVLDTLVRQGRRAVVRMLHRDVLRQWVRVNWGDAAVKLTPLPSLGVTEQRDLPAMMNAVANLQRAGYLHDSQYQGIDEDLNLPARDLTAEPAPVPAPEPAPAGGQPSQDGNQQDGQPADAAPANQQEAAA